MPHLLAFILLTTIAGLHDPFAPSPPAPPPKTYDQSLSLHPRWNLVSWHIEPLTWPFYFWQILPNPSWFTDAGGQLFKWNDNDLYWPPNYGTETWMLDYAYYLKTERIMHLGICK